MSTVDVTATVDTYADQNEQSKNFGDRVKLWLKGGGGSDKRAFVFFAPPFPAGVTVLAATLRVHLAEAWGGSQTLSAVRITQAWSEGKLNWNNKPNVDTGEQADVSVASLSAGDEVELDVTDLMAAVAAGATFYGIRLEIDASVSRALASSDDPDVSLRPELVVEWSEAPQAPTSLAPAGGRVVSVTRPRLTWQFVDNAGSVVQAESQVQTSTSSDFSSPNYDSGWVANTVSAWDLAATAFPAIADGDVRYWRVRVRDGAGLESAWSDPVSWERESHGALTITNPVLAEIKRNRIKNPSFELATTNWSHFESATSNAWARSGSWAESGGFSLYQKWTGTGAGQIGLSFSLTGASGVSVVAGSTYHARCGVNVLQKPAAGIALYVYWYDAGGANISQTQADDTTALGEQVLSGNVVAPVGAAFAAVAVGVAGPDVINNAEVAEFYADAFMFNLASVLTDDDYFDGSTTRESSAEETSWSGTAHNSESILSATRVEETTPPIAWTFTGRTQEAYSVHVYRVNADSSLTLLADSGRTTGTDTSWTVPAGTLRTGDTYRVEVTVWDDLDRQAMAGDPDYVRDSIDFTYVRSGTPAAVTALSATPDGAKVVLEWSRSTMPDYFAVVVDGVEIEDRIEPTDVLVSGTDYALDWWRAVPRIDATYEIEAVVLDTGVLKHSDGNATDTARTDPIGIWLADPTDSTGVFIAGKEKAEMGIGETAETMARSGSRSPVRITESIEGYAGSFRGVLIDTDDQDADEARDTFLMLKGRLAELRLIIGDLNIPVRLEEVSAIPEPDATAGYLISFAFFQTDEFSFDVTGD